MSEIKCYTTCLDDASRCITQLQNAAAASEFTIVSKPRDTAMLFDHDQQSTFAMDAFAGGKHLFGGNQVNSYTVTVASYPIANKVGMEFNINYMSSPKSINDLRCTCALIAKDLLNQPGASRSFENCLLQVQRFFTKQFRYMDSGQSEAHSAVDLMRSGTGVCQAIAAMATIILPFMGIPSLYISGEGYSGYDWGPHGWNAVKSPSGRWFFIDFTFGLNSILFPPSTINAPATKRFLKNHRWDVNKHSEEQLERTLSVITRIKATTFTIRPNKQTFIMDGIMVSAGRQLLQINEDNHYTLDLVFLFRLLGGGVEYIPDKDRLHFVLYNEQAYIEDASSFMNEDGTFYIHILREIPMLQYSFGNNGIMIQLGGNHE